MKPNKDILNKIRSSYILKQIYNNLNKTNSFELIKYNKKLQKRLNIKLKDYKKYNETYTPIEIELIPAQGVYGNFINFYKSSNSSSYIHIYFDDSKKEVKRNYLCEKDKISKIRIVIDYQLKSLFGLFLDCVCIETIRFIKFYRNNITDMCCMFSRCSSLKEVDFSNFNTDKVTNMSGIFNKCSSLIELNLSNFNTNKVTNMVGMFLGCSLLKKINLSHFNTNKVTNMSGMFLKCS